MPDNSMIDRLNARIVRCRKCPRLIEHCRKTAREKRAAFRDQTYWGKPVPNFGDPEARLLIVGLAPAAHGANRTGRMFTGDRSGDFLYRAMHRAGLASQAQATQRGDGLGLTGAMSTAACHCAPPANKPTREELTHCQTWLDQTFDALTNLRVVLCLGKIGLDAVLRLYKRRQWITKMTAYTFVHAAEHKVEGAPTLLCSYHPSQQNTFTGKLTDQMLLDVFKRAKRLMR